MYRQAVSVAIHDSVGANTASERIIEAGNQDQRFESAGLDDLGETVTISDNSLGHSGGGGEQRSCQSNGNRRPSTALREAFPELIPARPYCGDVLSEGLMIRTRSIALSFRHIQLNGPASFRWMSHDIDQPGAYYAHDDANLPPPNVIMINPINGRAHSAYLLATPVARHNLARIKPLSFYAAVERGIARRLHADRHYVGLITKNPMHEGWKVEWRRDDPYTLSELEDNLFE
jgi:hypothetical protein